MTLNDATVGKDLQTTSSGTLTEPAPAGNLQVTIRSLAPTNVLVSPDGTTAGTSEITVQVDAGSSVIPTFFVHGLQSSGTAQIEASAPGYAHGSATVSLWPSGFGLAAHSCFGGGSTISTTSLSADTPIRVCSTRLDPGSLEGGNVQPLRGGIAPVNVTVTSSNIAVGTVTVSPVTFNANDSNLPTAFDPQGAGTAYISVSAPGFTTPSNYNQITANVSP
jgi:hypothetical protein